MAAEKKDQQRWNDLGRVDLRHASEADCIEDLELVVAGTNTEKAEAILATHLGFSEGDTTVVLHSPVGSVTAHREHLPHIVEKRGDARERYVKFALATLGDPYEVWEIEYDDDSVRWAYIGLFKGKKQMLVVVQQVNGRTLWNFMHSDHKSLNKHRHGRLLYERPQKTKGEPCKDSPETMPVADTPQ